MKKTVKIWLLIASALLVLGACVFCLSACSVGWDFSKLATQKFETNIHEITEEFTDISISVDTADIYVLPSKDGECKVVCYEKEKTNHSVAVNDGTLKIDYEFEWYDTLDFGFEFPKITVYLPNEAYSSLNVNVDTSDIEVSGGLTFTKIDLVTSTGDVELYASAEESVKIYISTGEIDVENITAASLDISASSGDVEISGTEVSGNIKIVTSTGDISLENVSATSVDLTLSSGDLEASNVTCSADFKFDLSTGKSEISDVKCKNLISSANTGSLRLRSVIASGKFTVIRSTGDVILDSSDAEELYIETDTGDVRGTILTEKIFIPRSSTGDIEVPKTVTGGRCEITTSTGDIIISIK